MKALNAEALGTLADIVDALIGSLTLRVPDSMHVDQMKRQLPTLRDSLRSIVVSETGENPWETHP